MLGAICAGGLAVTATNAAASAQYFGQNKVQYKRLAFEVLKTEHFDIYFYADEREGVDIAARLAERWYARFRRLFAHDLRTRQPLILYAAHADFEQTNVIDVQLGESTGGVTEPLHRRIVLPMAGALADTDHVIGHELVHAFQFDITSVGRSPYSGLERLPLWFVEGMAEYLSIGPNDVNTAMWMADAARDGMLPSIKDLNNPKYFPYRWGEALWAYIGGRFGDSMIVSLLSTAGATGDAEFAFKSVLGLDAAQLSADWQASIRETYGSAARPAAAPPGRVLIKGHGLGASMNVGPSISPDGRWLAFLSERNFFSADMYIANAADGRIVHRLTSTATDAHYSSIQFVYSAGAWDHASRRVAVAAEIGGRAVIAIFDGRTGKRERDLAIPGVDEIQTPTWSPDGRSLCFSAISRGVTDLFVYDIADARLRRLTDDAYADVQPSWSPDGRRIAFATDRFSTEMRSLRFGPLELAIVDPASGQIERLPTFPSGRSFNPQWISDGKALAFVSDHSGIPNLYRVDVSTRAIDQVTTVATGVSGITSTSPAISAAERTNELAFSVYEHGSYAIYTLDASAPTMLSGQIVTRRATLPPATRRRSEIADLIDNPSLGLPSAARLSASPYTPTLTLDTAAQPIVALGVNRFGAEAAGGAAFSFSDMLGNRTLAVSAGLQSWLGSFSWDNVATEVVLFDRTHRWHWGVVAGQVPYVSFGFQSSVATTPAGDNIQTDSLTLLRETERSAAGVLAYPIDRAHRVELQTGVSQIAFDQVLTTASYSLTTGEIFQQSTGNVPVPHTLTLGITSAAFVSDTANMGATGPVQGQRYRLEADPTFGSVGFEGVLADYRRYFMPVPFYTLAFRALHYGRYGSGADDPRLFPVYIGYPGFVRGYDPSSFDATECTTPAAGCTAINQLTGSRMLIENIELRFPLLRPFGLSPRMYGPLPTEVAFFADNGVAWSHDQRPWFTGGSRHGASSVGVTLRANLLGFAVGEFDFARPLDRPNKGWMFEFNLLPGW